MQPTLSSTGSSSVNGQPPRITVLAGGVGGATFLLGVREVAQRLGAEVTAIINTGDDATMHGLRVCPDLDSVMYTLGGAHDPGRGWGQVGETWVVGAELKEYAAGPTWFNLGDKDIATHLVRTQMLDAGFGLADVTAALCHRWQPGISLLPMTDQRCETHVVADVPDDDGAVATRAIHFQEWWVRWRADVPTHEFVQIGIEQAKPAPGVLDAINNADVVLLAPSNPIVSIGTILAIQGIGDAVRATKAPVIGLSPIIDGAPIRGMADKCLRTVGVESTAAAVAQHYGARSAGGVLDGWLVHDGDPLPEGEIASRAVPLLMSDVSATAAMVDEALRLADAVRA
ncbi:LPPG:FO 2-phospho-L-lactate transferase [Antricoccus suffuscus]|uniref:LPPG:FO 2-phospho-L-lactate transferase n=1 Tax=Antricoccus suffuscus TaxID=1629062 RepID=A0A2T0ZQI3_9ACTN|nr:2-phospho-L-lactate transferase [Antricoccus suffuscus]PRZ38601.1 LPPG:FO 2-phospho-L-lactate transferase [Antricoccus suffuscus]